MATSEPKERARRRNSVRPGQIQALLESIARGYAKFKIVMPAEHIAKDAEFQFLLGCFKLHPHHLDEIKLWSERVQPLMTGGTYSYPESEFVIPRAWGGPKRAPKAKVA